MYRDEYNVQDRVGGILDADLMTELGINDGGDVRDPVQRFKIFVKMLATEMANEKIIDINVQQDIPFMLRRINDLPSPQYKNATAYVLGFWIVTSNEKYNKINNRRLNKLEIDSETGFIKNVVGTVKKHDVIRYCRLWILHNLLIK
jgi:hypothetical protein